jgi:hypothetical protein
MPLTHDPRFPYRNELEMPVIGLEAEFRVFVDDELVVPEEFWRTPAAFIDRPLLKRSTKSSQLPTGGAVYFDGGVIEVVTPVIEIAPQCTARVVRSLWEQITFVREQLDRWETRYGKRVRLQAFSSHCNISYELGREQRGRNRTIQKLAYLLAHVLPAPVIVTGANRRSTGVGVRPRRDRVEITLDFTPDPGLMAATVALIVGVVRDVISWPTYQLEDMRGDIPRVTGVDPQRHPTRSGWIVRDYLRHGIDEAVWQTDFGPMSLRQIALAIALAFRESIRRDCDPFSYRLLFSVLRGEQPSLLDLADRPAAYDDVGRTIGWGDVLPELGNLGFRRKADLEQSLAPPWRGESTGRRTRLTLPARIERRSRRERRTPAPTPPPARLTRSAYERVFRKLATGKRLQIGNELLTPVAVKGWYHSVFRTANGEERLMSIDQILKSAGQWKS